MGVEIEHKFLVANDDWKKEVTRRVFFRQGYLQNEAHATVRVRIAGDEAFLTIKSPRNLAHLMSRTEFEYPIPVSDAEILLETICSKPQISKYRNYVPAGQGGLTWEIDEFLGENEGLVVAELEVPSESYVCPHPGWLGREVTGDTRYFNSELISNPYRNWK